MRRCGVACGDEFKSGHAIAARCRAKAPLCKGSWHGEAVTEGLPPQFRLPTVSDKRAVGDAGPYGRSPEHCRNFERRKAPLCKGSCRAKRD